MPISKQKQIEDFLSRENIDILHLQEINVEEETFSQCNFILSNYHVVQNNAFNKYGTASIIRSNFNPENIKMDTNGRSIFFDISGLTFGNIYFHSGTDAISRSSREKLCSEVIPDLLVDCKENGCWGGDFNCITKAEDCTHNPESKTSPSLKRLLQAFSMTDSFRVLFPDISSYSRYYSRGGGEVGASRIDRSYHWGNVNVVNAKYEAVAFTDHLAHIVVLQPPVDMMHSVSPKSKPFFKTSPELVRDEVFKARLQRDMEDWQEVLVRGLGILPWWEIIVKPGIKRLAINRSKELKKLKRSRLNCLLMKQGFFTREVQDGNMESLVSLRQVQSEIK